MAPKPTQITSFTVQGQEPDNGSAALFRPYLYHWPFFLISLVVFSAAAFIYLKFSDPTYEIRAKIVIKKDNHANNRPSLLDDVELSAPDKLLENEIEVLKSIDLITKVVHQLNLSVNYQKKEGIKYVDLYKASPVTLMRLDSSIATGPKSLSVQIKSDKTFLLKAEHGDPKLCYFGQVYNTDLGKWKLVPTKHLASYRNSQLRILINDPNTTALGYQGIIDVSPTNKLATSVDLALFDKIPERGKDVLSALISIYNISSISEKNKQVGDAIDFLDKRLDSLSNGLESAEKGIERFKSERGITDLSANAQIMLDNMQSNEKKLNEVNVQLSVVSGVEQYINNLQNGGKAPTTLGISDPGLISLIERLAQLQMDRDKLLATTPETNPDFDPINRQIATTRAAIRENVKNIKISLINTRDKLASINSGFEQSIKNIPLQERQFISIKRQQASKEELYTYLLQKREELSVNLASSLTQDRVIENPYVISSQKRHLVVYGCAFLFGLLLPFGFLYTKNRLVDRIAGSSEIRNILNIPVAIEVPHLKKGSRSDSPSNNAVYEQFRSLRTKLSFLNAGNAGGRTILVTSSVPGEGKTFATKNLAAVLANSNRRTVVLELDLRKPKIGMDLKLDMSAVGITEFLRGNATVDEIIQKTVIDDKLYAISCGTAVNNPSELLENGRLGHLLEALKSSFDDIVIDSPPLNLVTDAMILSRYSDLNIFVIRQGYTAKADLQILKGALEDGMFHNMSIIFNGINRNKYGYGYKYDDSYYSRSS